MLRSPALDAWAGATLFVKAEHHQHAGAFKYRGATNAVRSLSSDDASRGIAAHSSGNHAAALARAAHERGIAAYVVMPEGTTAFKSAAVARYGAEIVWCAGTLASRRAVLAEVLARTGASEIHPFDDPRVIAGAGTAALELCEDVPGLDVVVAPIGGGGLCAGTSVAVSPVRVIGGQPVDRTSTMADGLRTGTSPRTETILADHAVERVLVGEEAIADAMHAVRERLNEVVEPSAAVAFAAARLSGLDGLRVGIICSGGNLAVSNP